MYTNPDYFYLIWREKIQAENDADRKRERKNLPPVQTVNKIQLFRLPFVEDTRSFLIFKYFDVFV